MTLNPIASVADMVKAVVAPMWNWLDDRKFTEQERAEMATMRARVEADIEKEFIIYEEHLADARSRVTVAELQQSDKFTKRARPCIIYVGLFVIVVNYVLVSPIMTLCGHPDFQILNMPDFFWNIWLGICGAYIVGRTIEKKEKKNT